MWWKWDFGASRRDFAPKAARRAGAAGRGLVASGHGFLREKAQKDLFAALFLSGS